jgi:hypothetical protein
MISHLWQERRAEIASDPDLRAAAKREFERQQRGFKKMRMEVLLLRQRSRILAMQGETNRARFEKILRRRY